MTNHFMVCRHLEGSTGERYSVGGTATCRLPPQVSNPYVGDPPTPSASTHTHTHGTVREGEVRTCRLMEAPTRPILSDSPRPETPSNCTTRASWARQSQKVKICEEDRD